MEAIGRGVLVNASSLLLSDSQYAVKHVAKPSRSAEIKCFLTAAVTGKTLCPSAAAAKCFQCEWF